MQIASRQLCLAVLLALLVGHASFAVHAAGHNGTDAIECKLCISYGNASDALPYEPVQTVEPAREAYSPIHSERPVETRHRVHFLQRGPPISG